MNSGYQKDEFFRLKSELKFQKVEIESLRAELILPEKKTHFKANRSKGGQKNY